MNVLFKTLTVAAIVLSLIACSASDEEAAVAVVQAPPVVVVQPPVVTPSPVVFCSQEVTINCEMHFCPQALDTSPSCPPSPQPVLPVFRS
jgi:hypothetical protein